MKTNFATYIIIILLVSAFSFAFGQYRISGTVKSDKGNAIPLASVLLSPSNKGAKTDSTGKFSIEGLKGKQVLSVSSIGYKLFKKDISLDSSLYLDIVLKPDTRTLNEVTISAGSFEASDKAKGASLTAMDAFTVAGSMADLSLALRSLPGAQQVGDLDGLFVRGGTGDETKQFIDGTLLKNPNYPRVPGVQQYARVNPILFKGILFSTGGYSALYGQAMSSALILESNELPEKSSAYFAIFPPSSNAGIQQLSRNKKSSYGVTLRYSNATFYNSIVKQKPDYFRGPEYIEGDANFRIKTGKTGMLKFYTNWDISDVGMRNADIDSTALRSSYQVKGKSIYNNLSYKDYLTDKWQVDAGLVYSYNEDHTINGLLNIDGQPVNLEDDALNYKNAQKLIRSNFAQGRIVFTNTLSNNQALRFGAEHFYNRDRGFSNDSTLAIIDNLSAAFVEGDIYLAKNLAAKIGTRIEYSSLLNKAVVAPRASLAYRLKDGGQFNLAYGIFYQEPLNEILYRSTDLKFSRAAHYMLNYTKKANNRFLRIEAYRKQYNDLVKTIPVINNEGSGYAQGVELFFRDKKTIKNLDYWVTYTYLDTKRNYLNYPFALQPAFATPHTATIAIKQNFQDINTYVNVSYAIATGRPYYDIRYSADDNACKIFDQGKTKAYSVMNLQIAHLFSIFSSWKQRPVSGFSVGVNNILGTKQVFGYNYSLDGTNKVPITLPATRFFYAGIFMSFGIDRTSDFLDKNL
ncbi:TonB-dependent receptor [Pedobacter panaciterrae]|uniref:TonB-dependent receptor n=1 Tax=Pedobacter panaciterrae TaxID=363849 RepID=UPI002595A490|nr:TonB-dependent receptor [uncultured Pedobacter sp.]